MKKTNKKGFTIVELVIVIAIIAVLAAVLIPTFAGVIKKANESADIQAVREMNTALTIEGVTDELDVFEVFDVLAAAGMTAKDYKPLISDRTFYWDPALKAILYVDADKNVIFPEEHAEVKYVAGTTVWQALTLSIAPKAPEGLGSDSALKAADSITVKSGEELAFVLDAINEGKTKTTVEVVVDGSVDMMGATFYVPTVESGESLTIKGVNGAKIVNATAVDVAKVGDGKTSGRDGLYGSGLIADVQGSVTISGVTFDNLNVKNLDAGNAALLFGSVSGKATIENVTITNSTLIAHHNMGALVGYVGGKNKVVIKGTNTLENVDIKTVGGRSGLVFGHLGSGAAAVTADDGATIKLKNCTSSIYECDRNTAGTYGDVTITGVTTNADGASIQSWELVDGVIITKVNKDTGATEARPYYNNVYQGNAKNNAAYTYITVVQ